ncbi:hypothetical protein ACCAA_200053 [Candidatus Accumulibacter aalborgensis]|uniref:Uncharacterized protein n=1 Tax=Candidatus Accumulibacter aalborgensis TaxID=1860102 RepID=A0A1A8XJB7_9PROT|nr:hypothetical protein ACCAA_200053 [Candidatus Accumulibacter aalborgensis]
MSHNMPCKRTENDGANDGIPMRINMKPLLPLALRAIYGGESGIRTRGRIAPTHAFQACDLNHSSISPISRRF